MRAACACIGVLIFGHMFICIKPAVQKNKILEPPIQADVGKIINVFDSVSQSVSQSVGDLSGKPTLSPEVLARIAENKEVAKRRKASKRANLSPEMIANIVAKREVANLRA